MVKLMAKDETGVRYDFFNKDTRLLLKSEEKVEVWLEGEFAGRKDKVLLFSKPTKFIGSGRVEYGLNLLSRVDWAALTVEVEHAILSPLPEGHSFDGVLMWSLGTVADHYLQEASVMLADGHVSSSMWVTVDMDSEQYRQLSEKGLLRFYTERVGLNKALRREA